MEIKTGKNSRIEERIKTWRAQFPMTAGTNLVRISDVVDKIKQTGEVDDIFEMNFLVVMTNVLIRSNTNNSVTQTILSLNDELDNCGNYNWARYLIENLVITKKRWMHTSSLFFTGTIIFLLVLYVDRVLFGEKTLVRRKFPAFIGWTKDKLKQREVMEADEGAFGSGVLLAVATAEELEENERIDRENARHDIMIEWTKDKLKETEVMEGDDGSFSSGVLLEENQRIEREEKNDAGIEKGNAEIEVRDVEHDNGQNLNNGAHKNWWVELNQKAVFLIDANIQFTEAKAEYEIGLANAKALHPNDENIFEIEKKIKDLFKSNKWMDSESCEDDFCKNDTIFPSQDDEVVVHTVDVVENIEAIENNELPPDHDDYLDIIAWLQSPEGMLEIEKDFEDQYIPSFSLGVSQICKEVMEEHGTDDGNNEEDDNRTPVPPKEPEKRTKRNVKVGPAFRSPYIERNIDINSSYSNQEIVIYREHIFVYGKHTVIRELFKTLIPGQKLSYGIIDVWSLLMNDRENYKSMEAPMRLYMDIDVSLAPLDERNTKEVQYELFKSEMNHYFERYPNRKMENANLKTTFDVIDNIRRGRTVGKEYGPKPKLLLQHFVKYLMESKLELMANSLKNVKPNYMVMPWQTLNNYKDCGIFLMRHMETYKGDQNAWITNLKTESILQKTQLIRLRAKYAHAILASPLNEKRKQIINEEKVLYNKMTSEKVTSIVLAASEGKKVAVRGKKEIKGKVLFGEDDTPEDDN
ncbi:hypothetical protein POM88_052120 [Heracleum sosnowskyi]|uniref:Ubiquitin-like protease family profile domain-containing protein n=1 Tax=Heracleum sosnowskyi TaxID=360622 RepID=A0AAD8GT97_9APIA|nr:hypothetical protein POM88_052120 [Heracleum sosnowskyi]